MMEITGFRILSFQVRIRTKEGTELICVTQTEYIFVVVQNCTPVLIKPRADALSGVSRQPELCSKLTLAVDLPEEHCSGASGRHGQSRAFSFCSLRALLANGIPHWFPRPCGRHRQALAAGHGIMHFAVCMISDHADAPL